jgi:glyoxylase-like metal-dependent hydrolase (beta-lactamase superfamily II)
MIKIEKFVFNPFSENTYIIWDDESKSAIIVDPGCFDKTEETILKVFIEERELDLKYLINTHCHIDHILGCKFIKDLYNPTFLIPRKDLPLLKNVTKQAEMFGIEISNPPQPDQYLSEDLVISLNKSEIKFIFTPGHTPGEFCLYLKTEKILISGDVLFKESIGRTDLWGGNYEVLINSIRTKLLTLPNDVKVLPGHGDETTIGFEKEFNPFLNTI